MCSMPKRCASRSACVPFPAPGGASISNLMGPSSQALTGTAPTSLAGSGRLRGRRWELRAGLDHLPVGHHPGGPVERERPDQPALAAVRGDEAVVVEGPLDDEDLGPVPAHELNLRLVLVRPEVRNGRVWRRAALAPAPHQG